MDMDLCSGIVKKVASQRTGSQVWYNQYAKGNGIQWSGSDRGIKSLVHAMKVVERIFEHKIRQQIDIDNMQFVFIKEPLTPFLL